MKQIEVFSPIKDGKPILPEEYVLVYPELSRREETKNLRGIDLIFCWFYGSKESPFKDMQHADKCEKISDLVFNTINKGSYDENKIKLIVRGTLPREWYRTIDFFKTRDADTRSRAKSIIDKMFDECEKMIDMGVDAFKDKDGIIDYNKYSSVISKVQDDLDMLVKKKEEGFGISEHFIGLADGETEGDYWNRYYLKQK